MSNALSKATIKRATLNAHRVIEKLDAESAQELIDIYEQAADDIESKIIDAAGRGDQVGLAKLADLREQVQQILGNLGKERDRLLAGALESASDWGVRPYATSNSLTPAAMRTSTDALKFVRNFIAADGLQLSDRVWRIDLGARDRIINALEMAIIQGSSAGEAARDFLSRGEAVPDEVANKLTAANARTMSATARTLLTGPGSALNHTLMLFRTEINRAHGEAYMMGGEKHPDFAGWKYLLSPAHPEPDICDLLSVQNLHGLGPGVYPSREKTPWPAHPNTLSFIEIVFKDEITEADRAGQETPIDALGRLTDAQREGVLGQGKLELYRQGRLTQGMIRSPWSAVKARIDGNLFPATDTKAPAPTKPTAKPSAEPLQLDAAIRLGALKGEELLRKAAKAGQIELTLPGILHEDLNRLRSTLTAAVIQSKGDGARLVKAASQLFPDDWTQAADAFGPLYVRYSQKRGWQATLPPDAAGKLFKVEGFKILAKGNDGIIQAGRFTTAVHEYTHRLQAALPELDDLFQQLHHRRTKGDPIKRLRDLTGFDYSALEVAREDSYVTPYQGKIYNEGGQYGALEVMTIAFEYVLGGNPLRLKELLETDREMFDLVIGALYHYVP